MTNAHPVQSSENQQPSRLTLCAYLSMADHGLALPCFADPEARGNAIYTATAADAADRSLRLASFMLCDPGDVGPIYSLRIEQHRAVTVGDPWLDVFLWRGTTHVGTRAELWRALSVYRADMRESAPLSLLSISDSASDQEAGELAAAAYRHLLVRNGSEFAMRWRMDTFVRRHLVNAIRHALGPAAHDPAVMRLPAYIDITVMNDDVLVTSPTASAQLADAIATAVRTVSCTRLALKSLRFIFGHPVTVSVHATPRPRIRYAAVRSRARIAGSLNVAPEPAALIPSRARSLPQVSQNEIDWEPDHAVETEDFWAIIDPPPPEEFSIDAARQMILAGQQPPSSWIPHIHRLDLRGYRIRNWMLIGELKYLHTLELSRTGITSVAPLSGLIHLQRLNLARNPINDLSPLSNLANLQSLNLGRTKIANLAPLANLANLQSLSIWRTNVTDLTPIALLSNLKHLDIADLPKGIEAALPRRDEIRIIRR